MKQILVVDDEEVIRHVVAEILEKISCGVMTTADPREAFDLCNMKRFDVVITDLNMPGISGIELAHRLRQELTNEEGPERIVLMTSDRTDDLDAATLRLFATILRKPFSMDALTQCVQV